MVKKRIVFLFIVLCLGLSNIWAAHPPGSQVMRKPLLSAVEEAIENSLLKVARTSVVQIEQYWENQDGSITLSLCKGVLINEGKQLVSHSACLQRPGKADEQARVSKVFLHFSNGYIYGSNQLKPVLAKAFIYWSVPDLGFLEDIEPAELSVSDGGGVVGQFGYDWDGVRNASSEQEFVFLGKRGWHFGSFVKQTDAFTLKNALRERQLGEPVFIGRRVIALNGAGGKEGFGWGYPFHRPVFIPFTSDNGGEILQNL